MKYVRRSKSNPNLWIVAGNQGCAFSTRDLITLRNEINYIIKTADVEIKNKKMLDNIKRV